MKLKRICMLLLLIGTLSSLISCEDPHEIKINNEEYYFINQTDVGVEIRSFIATADGYHANEIFKIDAKPHRLRAQIQVGAVKMTLFFLQILLLFYLMI